MFNELKLETKHNACFVAGTLVHTDKGLVPIQDLKVGDMVLSRDEFDPTGELVYKPVLNTFKSAEKIPLFRVRYFNTKHLESEGNRGNSHLFCSGNHPFWVIDNKNPNGEWVAAEKANDSTMLDKDGNELLVNAVSVVPVRTLPNFPVGWGYIQNLVDYDDKPLWRDEEGHGICFVKFTDKDYKFLTFASEDEYFAHQDSFGLWLDNIDGDSQPQEPYMFDPAMMKLLTVRLLQDLFDYYYDAPALYNFAYGINTGKGINFDPGDEQAVISDIEYLQENGNNTGLTKGKSIHLNSRFGQPVSNPYTDYVYNIEVADTHTYFVGYDGVWVHNKNCELVGFNEGTPLSDIVSNDRTVVKPGKTIIAMNVRNAFVNSARQGIADVNVILKLENNRPLWDYKTRERILATDEKNPLSGKALNKKIYNEAFDV